MVKDNEYGVLTVEKLPEIKKQIEYLKSEIDKDVENALSIVCTEETVQSVKHARSELKKRFNEFERQRKIIKSVMMETYNDFLNHYKMYITDTFSDADNKLKAKIDEIENEQKKKCEAALRDYFSELCTAYEIDWLRYEDSNIKIDLASAKSRGFTKLKSQMLDFFKRINDECEKINGMEDSSEIMVAYMRSLDLAQSIFEVESRKKMLGKIKGTKKSSGSSNQSNDDFHKPIEQEKETETETEEFFECSFIVRGTKKQLKSIKDFLEKEHIYYE